MRVLVTDDVSSNSKLLGRILKNHGHLFDTADDGKVAVEMIAASMREGKPYDTLLLDYEMPGMNGPTAAKEVRALGCNIFTVGVTGNLLPDDIAHFLDCGANAVLAKPFKMSALENLWEDHGVRPSPRGGDSEAKEKDE